MSRFEGSKRHYPTKASISPSQKGERRGGGGRGMAHTQAYNSFSYIINNMSDQQIDEIVFQSITRRYKNVRDAVL